jgi:predicted pyridoxine 5'-phosphate oxidase superfamily flavin-nucleotide-binding protein
MHTGYSSDVAFTPAVKAEQARRGSREMFAQREQRGGFRTAITQELAAFIAQADTAYLATASAAGQPYAQHRGGPPGFIRVLDDATLGMVDFAGNRQYVTTGNLSENDRAFLFLMDYAHRRRVKLWGTARMADPDAGLLERLMPRDYPARPEKVLLFRVQAWDVNCSQHIPQKLDAAAVKEVVERLESRIAMLEAENRRLRSA